MDRRGPAGEITHRILIDRVVHGLVPFPGAASPD
jgi:hypothetical protein